MTLTGMPGNPPQVGPPALVAFIPYEIIPGAMKFGNDHDLPWQEHYFRLNCQQHFPIDMRRLARKAVDKTGLDVEMEEIPEQPAHNPPPPPADNYMAFLERALERMNAGIQTSLQAGLNEVEDRTTANIARLEKQNAIVGVGRASTDLRHRR